MLKKIKSWYEGKFTPYENDPHSRVFVLGWSYERHWTARAARVLVEFYLREWKWLFGTVIALAGLALALMRLG